MLTLTNIIYTQIEIRFDIYDNLGLMTNYRAKNIKYMRYANYTIAIYAIYPGR